MENSTNKEDVQKKECNNSFKIILAEFDKEDHVKQVQSLLRQKFNLGITFMI